ncbi:hypothetical protein CSUI_007840 [Cystoisospora suis]|uniref:Transmembrane protein n=1 Tax=Cystoisospora suis TaxID=483139 RepID=A0A2C6KPC9_9APIC|nr:hypothetical protein CSUI_007840 [Cystoisospora suis]
MRLVDKTHASSISCCLSSPPPMVRQAGSVHTLDQETGISYDLHNVDFVYFQGVLLCCAFFFHPSLFLLHFSFFFLHSRTRSVSSTRGIQEDPFPSMKILCACMHARISLCGRFNRGIASFLSLRMSSPDAFFLLLLSSLSNTFSFSIYLLLLLPYLSIYL